MTTIHRPHTRTHTLVLKGCRNARAIVSPKSDEGRLRLMRGFVNALEHSGFIVTASPRGRKDVLGRPFIEGDGYGYTMTAILSESHAAIHTYPEKIYGATVEIEFNLCYLNKDHLPQLRKAKEVFADKFRARSVRMSHSQKRYLTPYE